MLATTGAALQVLGLIVAISGVAKTYETVLDRRLLPDLWRNLRRSCTAKLASCWRWIRTKLLKRPPPQRTGTASGSVSVIGTATGMITARLGPAPGADATPQEQIAYLLRSVDQLQSELDRTREQAATELARTRAELSTQNVQISDRLNSAVGEIRQLHSGLVGHDGAGLRTTVIGLAITLVGVVLSAIPAL